MPEAGGPIDVSGTMDAFLQNFPPYNPTEPLSEPILTAYSSTTNPAANTSLVSVTPSNTGLFRVRIWLGISTQVLGGTWPVDSFAVYINGSSVLRLVHNSLSGTAELTEYYEPKLTRTAGSIEVKNLTQPGANAVVRIALLARKILD